MKTSRTIVVALLIVMSVLLVGYRLQTTRVSNKKLEFMP